MNKLDFIKKHTTYDQDMKKEFLRGYRKAYDNMTEIQRAQLRTAEDGMIVTCQAAINKMIEDAVKNVLYAEKQKRAREQKQMGSAEELYQRIKSHAIESSDQTSPYYFVDIEDVKKEIFGPCMRSFYNDKLLELCSNKRARD